MKQCFYCKKKINISDDFVGDYNCEYCDTQNSFYAEQEDERCKLCIEIIGQKPMAYCELCRKNRKGEAEMPNVNDLKTYLCSTDVKDGDIIKFKDAGEFMDKDFSKEQDGSDIKTVLEMTVELPEGKTKRYSPNSRTRDALAEGFGSPNSEDWIGKEASVVLVRQNVFGQIKNIIYLEPIK